MLTKAQILELQSDLPRTAVKTREGGGGKDLSYVEGWYVIDRLNRIFGNGSWGYTLKQGPTLLEKYETTREGKTTTSVGYMAVVQLHISGFNESEELCFSGVEIEDVGFGSGKDRDPAAAHEKAMKEAVTDALKRCARCLGPSMGLALYDKSQAAVSGDEAPFLEQLDAASTKEVIDAIAARAKDAQLDDEALIRTKRAVKEARERIAKVAA
jgi:DNA recombination protein Rad52